MKKWISCLLMVMLLSGCAGGTGPDDSADKDAPEAPTAQQEQSETADESETPENAATPEEPANVDALPGEFPMELVYASGAGAWGTFLTLEADGSFTGNYHDSEMGAEGGPVCYICDFAGRFTDLRQVDEFTYAMTLESVENLSAPVTVHRILLGTFLYMLILFVILYFPTRLMLKHKLNLP